MPNDPRYHLGAADLRLTVKLTLKLDNIGYGETMPQAVVDTLATTSIETMPPGFKGQADLQLDCPLPGPELKTMIVDAALAGLISVAEAEDLIAFYGLKHA